MDETNQTPRDLLLQALAQDGRRMDGPCVVDSLDAGLSRLETLLHQRLHEDVELSGKDSLWALSEAAEAIARERSRTHLELYQAIECDQAALEFGYVPSDSQWFLQRLVSFRVGELTDHGLQKQWEIYRTADGDGRRLAFVDVLMRIMPQSSKVPLVLFRLAPLAVQIATALAFNDRPRALVLRSAQRAILPAIADCRSCRGAVLDNGQACTACGNPLWTFKWLTIAD